MTTVRLPWVDIKGIISEDSTEKEYVVDFLDQKYVRAKGTVVYFKDDDQSAVYMVSEYQQGIVEGILAQVPGNEIADEFWALMNTHYRITI